MHKFPKVSFLMLNWNGIDFTRKCLMSLLKIDYPSFEIIVVDNGSVENEADILEKEFKGKVKIVKNKKNLGYAAGMNVAIKNSTGKYLMILNNDMEFRKGWLFPLVETLEGNLNIAACQPKIKDLQNKKMLEHGGAAGGFMDIFGYPFARGRIFSVIEQDNGQYDSVVPICWCGIMLARKNVIDEVGGFKAIYFNYGEDMDLSYRIYGKGYIIVSVPTSVVYHFGGAALKKNMPRKFFFHHRSNIIFILINYPLSFLFLIILPRVAMDLITIFYYAINGYPELGFSVVKAYASLCILFPDALRERSKTQKVLKINSLGVMPVYLGSVVWKYYVERKRVFSEIMEVNKIIS